MGQLKLKNAGTTCDLASFLAKVNTPADAEQIMEYLKSKKLNTNKVTVYRVLDFLFRNKI